MNTALQSEPTYTIEDVEALPEWQRAELVDGQIHMMSSPSRLHQEILSILHVRIFNYIESKKGRCRVYPAPFAVYLSDEDGKHYFEPDITVVCDPDKLNDKGCIGAPDWIIEIVSPSTASRDYVLKTYKYQIAGVREYWIIDPSNGRITVYRFGTNKYEPEHYTFSDTIQVGIYDDFEIDFKELDLHT